MGKGGDPQTLRLRVVTALLEVFSDLSTHYLDCKPMAQKNQLINCLTLLTTAIYSLKIRIKVYFKNVKTFLTMSTYFNGYC